MERVMKKLVLLAAMAGCAAAAWSQAPTQPETQHRGTGNDPNEMVCINEAVIGSRLAKRRVCRTRAQWEEHQRQLRMAVETAQTQKQTSGQ